MQNKKNTQCRQMKDIKIFYILQCLHKYYQSIYQVYARKLTMGKSIEQNLHCFHFLEQEKVYVLYNGAKVLHVIRLEVSKQYLLSYIVKMKLYRKRM